MSGLPRVALLFGGASVEHEVSVVSARGIFAALDKDRWDCVPIGVSGEGAWLAPELSRRVLVGDAARVDGVGDAASAARVLVDPGGGGLLVVDPSGSAAPLAIDVALPVVHGWGGEDGRMQGVLDLAGIPCVGSGVLGSAVAMDKDVAKSLCARAGITVGPWSAWSRDEYRRDPEETRRRVLACARFPLFVKPANGGSSVGVSRVAEPAGLAAAFDAAFACDRKVLVEDAIDGREIECAVLGNECPEASVPGEIIPSREFYDYAAKYIDATSRLLIPAPLDPQVDASVRQAAVAVFRALELSGLARIDFFVERGTQRVIFNEANSLPGFTPISMYPKLWEATGLGYRELLDRLLHLAIARGDEERLRRTRWQKTD